MKSVFLFLMSLVLLIWQAGCNNSVPNPTPDKNKAKTEQQVKKNYTCSMHPDVKSDKPGKCPKCGMKLIVKSATVYTCSMHPDVKSDKPGKCPKCGMKLIVKSAAVYTCSMHPDVKSDKPGKCPKCGMKLIVKSQ